MHDRGTNKGFTLIEMLVALALLAMIAAYGLSALRTLTRVKELETQIDQRSVIAATREHLRNIFSDARIVFDVDQGANAAVSFRGTTDLVTVVAPLDDRTVTGGLYRLTYHLVEHELVLDHALFRPNSKSPTSERIPLVAKVSSIKFEYYGDPNQSGASGWNGDWQSKDRLPSKIRLNLQFDSDSPGNWPPLTITLMNVN